MALRTLCLVSFASQDDTRRWRERQVKGTGREEEEYEQSAYRVYHTWMKNSWWSGGGERGNVIFHSQRIISTHPPPL